MFLNIYPISVLQSPVRNSVFPVVWLSDVKLAPVRSYCHLLLLQDCHGEGKLKQMLTAEAL